MMRQASQVDVDEVDVDAVAVDAVDVEPDVTEYERACTPGGHGEEIRSILGHIGDKWALLIVGALNGGTRFRFGELQRHIPGISQRMLTVTLRRLERDGLVTRTVHAEVPPRVEYELTRTGATLIEPALALARWATSSYESILDSRAAYDASTTRKGRKPNPAV